MPVKVKMKEKPGTANMCSGCGVYCCTLIVDLTSYDIYRIAIKENRGFEDFVEALFVEPGEQFGFRAQGAFIKLVLKHSNNACVFFKKEADLKCTIEKSKPGECLAYPFSLWSGKLRDDAGVICPPGNYARADKVKMSAQALADCRWEAERYLEIIEAWNLTSDGSKDATLFLQFAAKEMQLESTPIGSLFRKVKMALLRKTMQR